MAEDPYKYFRIEAGELLDNLGAGALELEEGTEPEKALKRVLRCAHTLKGAAGTVKLPKIAEAAHAIEDLLAPHRGAAGAVTPEVVSELLRLVDTIGAGVSTLGEASPTPQAEPPVSEPAAAALEPADRTGIADNGVTVANAEGVATAGAQQPGDVGAAFDIGRIELGDLDALAENIAESGSRVDAMGQQTAKLALLQASLGGVLAELPAEIRAGGEAIASQLAEIHSDLDADLGHIGQEIDNLDRIVSSLRLLPIEKLATTLRRTARDAAHELGKQVAFTMAGGSERVDGRILMGLQESLLHLVRNAVAHGIESPEERLAAGKPARGDVAVRVRRDGYRVAVSCEDDGRGVALDSVRRAASESGVVSASAADALGEEKVFELLFEPGVSTSERIDSVSGRGVGLDVVRDSVTRLKGHARVESQPGKGTTVTLDLPVSTSSIRTLSVVDGERTAAVDLSAVASVNRLEDTEISHVGASLAVLHEGSAVPFVRLKTLWGAAGNTETLTGAVVVLKSGVEFVALGVETVGGIREAVLHPTPESAGALPVVSGFCLDGDGDPVAVIESKSLAGFAQGAVEQVHSSEPAHQTVLVVDDSLTTRMVQQSVLETAGYEVALATSAEEALEMMAANDYGLFLVDVEMPGMNGFELVEHLQKDPERREIPCVLVTTLGSEEHRRRGIQAGARAYIVKSEFSERELIQIVERLMG